MSEYIMDPGARLEIVGGKPYEELGAGSDYMLAPGARLEIGPGGKPYEELGACCGPCGARRGVGDSAFGSAKQLAAGSGTWVVGGSAGGGGGAGPIIAPPASSPGGMGALPILLGVGVLGVGGFLLVRRMRRKKR